MKISLPPDRRLKLRQQRPQTTSRRRKHDDRDRRTHPRGSGATHASRDKFPRAILPRTFDYGFATGLMVKDVRLCLEEAKAAGLSLEIAEAVERLWEVVLRETGADSDFTSVIKPIEEAAGVVVGGPR